MTVIDTTESLDLRTAFAKFPTGVAAICAVVDGIPRGLVASSFTVGVSMDPPLVSFAVQNTSTTWPLLRRAQRIGVSILSAEQQLICRGLASRNPDKFDDISYEKTAGGAISIPESSLWLECSIFAEHPAGDHEVVIFKVESAEIQSQQSPIVFHESAFKELNPTQDL